MLPSRSLLVTLSLVTACGTTHPSKTGEGDDTPEHSDTATEDTAGESTDSGDPSVPARRCPPPDGAIKSDAELEAYAGCTTIEGSVQIEGPGVGSLVALQHVEEIEGSLLIGQDTALRSLEGLGALRTLGGSLVLQNNAELTDASALSGLTEAHSLIAFGSPLLTHLPVAATVAEVELHSLPALEEAPGITVHDDLQFLSLPRLASWGALRLGPEVAAVRVIETGLPDLEPLAPLTEATVLLVLDNEALVSVSGLDNLRAVGTLRLTGSPLLAELGPLAALESAESLTLAGLPGLADSSGLAGLTTLSTLVLGGVQPGIDLSGLAGLRSLPGGLVIEDSGTLDLRPLAGLTAAGELAVLGSPGLTGLDGLAGLASLDTLRIFDNDRLESLAGLEALDTSPSRLVALDVLDNAVLSELGLRGVETVEDRVSVVLNPRLDSCVLEARAAEWGSATTTLTNNGPCR
jgi:hypothetical protein